MSKKPSRSKKTFPYTATHDVPAAPAIKTAWELDALYYNEHDDPQIEKDVTKTERAYKRFVKKWQEIDFTQDAATLLEALTEKEKLSGMPEASRVGRYFGLRMALDVNDQKAEEALALLQRRFRKIGDSMLFFAIKLGKTPKDKQKAFLKDASLAHFHYYLAQVFESAQYNLTEDQEKIINLKSSQSYGRWTDMTEKLVSNTQIIWKKQEVALPEAFEMIQTLSSLNEKEKLWQLILVELEKLSAVAEHEFNAIITDVRTEEELRGYKKPYSATALSYEDTEVNIEHLVDTVTKEGFKLSQKFYKIKAALHNKDSLTYAQRNASYGTEPEIPFTQAVDICRDVFYGVKNEYGEIFDRMLAGGQIDVFPKKGKQGGAFMSGQIGQPTQVFLNHTSTFNSLETLAHEMGHAIHTERSKAQTPFYQGYSTVCAETASTLFENLVFDAVFAQSSKKQQIALLHDRNLRDISTIQRQIAFFNLELEIHNTIFAKGAMSREELRAATFTHLEAYLGKSISLDAKDGYSFVYIPHLRFGFYVYSYTFGLMMSSVMAARYKEDKSYVENIDAFLSSGGTDTVKNIMKNHADIDISRPDIYTEALQTQAQNIKEFERLVNN